jgi:CBS-domain-containing membrane protein
MLLRIACPKVTARRKESNMLRVSDVMTADVVTVSAETTLKELARILTERRISGAPVVDEEQGVLGIVSETDILFKERGPSERTGFLTWFLDPHGPEGQSKLEARTAGEAMTSPAKTIAPWQTVASAAATMLDDKVNRLPVVDRAGKLLGIVTRADLVRAFVRSDADIHEEICEDVLRRIIPVPEAVRVKVAEGKVTLSGALDPGDAELVLAGVAKVPGVVEVRSTIGQRRNNGNAS